MKRNWMYVAGLVTTTALGALAIPAVAGDSHDDGASGHGHGSGMMHGRHAGRGGYGHGGHEGMMEMMRHMHGHGAGGSGMIDAMMDAFDADGDGTVTPDEMRAGLGARLTEYDADGSGTLSLDEFETLHSAMIREMTVDRFQFLDNDGDGQVTAEEITAPADRMERMRARRTRMMEGGPDQPDIDDSEVTNDEAPGDN